MANLLKGTDARAPDVASASAETGLSQREKEMLALVAQGRTNREVGQHLALSEKTVKNYMTDIMRRLGVRNRIEAAAKGETYHSAAPFSRS